MPNILLGVEVDALYILDPLEKLTKNRAVTMNGNIEGIRVFEQKMLDFTTLSVIYFAFVKNKENVINIKIMQKNFLSNKRYYYPFEHINISYRNILTEL